MASSLDEQSEDLSTCCVCMDPYDEGMLKPKSLPCLHTFCLKCAKVTKNHKGSCSKIFNL